MQNDFFSKEKEYILYDDKLVLVFTELENDNKLIESKINKKGERNIGFYNTFYFTEDERFYFDSVDDELYNYYVDNPAFIIGKVKGNYIHLDKKVFKIDTNVFVDKTINFNSKKNNIFYKYPNISLMKILSNYTKEDIFIDKKKIDEIGHFDLNVFSLMKKSIPSSTEIQYYKYNEIDKVLHEYFDDTKDYETLIENLKNKRINFDQERFINEQILNFESAGKVDLEKYKFILEQLNILLGDKSKLKEKEWQKVLLPYIRLLFPQYIYVVDEVKFFDLDSVGRRIDYLLIDYDGNVDIIELKIPDVMLLRDNTYRDNYIESRELVGTVMQCEKYLFNLTSNKEKNEKLIRERLHDKYSIDVDVKIVRPHAIIIAGRTNLFDLSQKKDFRIIRRKFSNIADIISYDDLLDRLKRLIDSVR